MNRLSQRLFAYIWMFCIGSSFFVIGEIQTVSIQWTPLLCSTTACIQLLDTQLRRVPQIADFSLDQQSGQALIHWRYGAPFTFSVINTPVRLVGLTIREIHLTVKGTISHDAQSVTLASTGDNTRFQLLNPVVFTPGQQATVFNAAGRQLTPALRQQLLEGEEQNLIAIISGPLFMPHRHSALQLVVEQLKFVKPAEQETTNAKPQDLR